MKRKDAIEAIKKASKEDLMLKIRESSEELLKIRCRQSSGQHDGGARRATLRREIARAKTELCQRECKATATAVTPAK